MAQSASEKIKSFKLKYKKELAHAIKYVTSETGQAFLDGVISRTKSGKGTTGKLKELTKKYIEFRRRWKYQLDKSTTPDTSNLTATGQLLEALYLRVVGDKFFIRVNTKTREQSLGGDSSRTEKTKTQETFRKKGKVGTRTKHGSISVSVRTNDEIRAYVEKAGREFLSVSPSEKTELDKYASDLFELLLQEILNTLSS